MDDDCVVELSRAFRLAADACEATPVLLFFLGDCNRRFPIFWLHYEQ